MVRQPENEPFVLRSLSGPAHEGDLDGPENMARDEALLADAHRGVVGWRVYGWNGPWVSIGRFQNADADLVDLSRIRWVRRPTGGKAVLHGHDVTVCLAVPLDRLVEIDRRSVRAVYRTLVEPIASAATECGLPAILAESAHKYHRGMRSGDCFGFCSPNDIVDPESGVKVCGCALRLTRSAALLQASIPFGPPLIAPGLAIKGAKTHPLQAWNYIDFPRALQLALARARLVGG